MRQVTILALCVLAMGPGAVAKTKPVDQRNSPLTSGNVSMNVVVGTTTQADVLEKFGAPNIVTMDGARNEVWSYQRHATVSQSSSSSSYWSVILLGGGRQADGFQQTQRTMTLIIKFDPKTKVVSDFFSRSSDF